MPEHALTVPLGAILAWLALAVFGLAAPRNLRFISRVLFPIGAGVGIVLAVAAVFAIPAGPVAALLPLGLPDLPFHARLDALGAFFLLLLGATAAAISLFSAGYFR